ncbi:alternative ribosome rescue aminoacyl-tRNA hydrolase ArfB [Tamlana sp. I1]|uniref:alternative ribosome rescue aminoacyl-tRNA hydrolase ArfB n=1 Tax=Tamlana sp. I1 TaxID=2762061 RepID=UPI0018900763|nr:alternative ribosome rescue aminoacyl-tRNA hydrolase ArfB [Tamlana sp. I1]
MFDKENVIKELSFKAIRSSGSGGQHVNKVASKIELTFNLKESSVFSEAKKERLLEKLENRLTNDGVLILTCDESRSQHKNKTLVIERLFSLIEGALKVRKRRIPTKIPKSVIRKRLKSKKQQADKKANRRKPDVD